jgi:hypothetical protein
MVGLCRILQITLAAATAASLVAAPRAARADIINPYVFAPDSTTVLDGVTLLITGSFTFDLTTITESNVTVKLSGASSVAGTYASGTFVEGESGLNSIVAADDAAHITIAFENSLDVSPDETNEVSWQQFTTGQVYQDLAPTTSAVFGTSAAVPEPTGLALLGVALVLFLFYEYQPQRAVHRIVVKAGRGLRFQKITASASVTACQHGHFGLRRPRSGLFHNCVLTRFWISGRRL